MLAYTDLYFTQPQQQQQQMMMKKQSEKVSPIKAANKHNKSPFYPPPQPKVAAGHGGFVKDPLVVSMLFLRLFCAYFIMDMYMYM